MNDPHADPTLWTPEDFLPHDPEQRAAMWRARALALLEQLETAHREIDDLNERVELRAEEDSIYRVYDDEVERRQRAVDALRGMLDCVDRHDEWCGHNKDAPGNGIINRAPEKARAVLERELAERILADKASPPQALLAAHRFVYWGDPEKLRALMAEASSPAMRSDA